MNTMHRWIPAACLLTAVLGFVTPPAHALAPSQDKPILLPGDLQQFRDNVQNFLSPNDAGTLGSGEKDSTFRKQIGRVVLRFDFKVVPNFGCDARGKGNDDLAVDSSKSGFDKDAKDAGGPIKVAIDCIGSGALDLDFGKPIEALSLEYKDDLLKEEKESTSKLTGIRKLLADDSLTLKIAGFTIRCPDPDATSAAEKSEFNQGNLLKNGIKVQFWAGPVPIIVRGNAGACLNLNVGLVADIERSALGLEFEPAAYIHGWLSAGIGVAYGPCSISAGIAGKLRFLDTTVPIEGGVCFHPDAPFPLYGTIGITVQPLKVEVQLFAQLQIGWASRTFTWTVFTAKNAKLTWKLGSTPRDPGYFPLVAPVDPMPPEEPGTGGAEPTPGSEKSRGAAATSNLSEPRNVR